MGVFRIYPTKLEIIVDCGKSKLFILFVAFLKCINIELKWQLSLQKELDNSTDVTDMSTRFVHTQRIFHFLKISNKFSSSYTLCFKAEAIAVAQ